MIWKCLICTVRLLATSILVIHFVVSGLIKITDRIEPGIHVRFVQFYEEKAVVEIHKNLGILFNGKSLRIFIASLEILVAVFLLTPFKCRAAFLGFIVMAALAQIMIWIDQDYTIEAVLSGLCALIAFVDINTSKFPKTARNTNKRQHKTSIQMGSS